MTTADLPPGRLLTVNDVANVLQLSPRTVRRLIAGGRLRVIRFGRAVRVHPSALTALVDESGQEKTAND